MTTVTVTNELLKKMCVGAPNMPNLHSVVVGLNTFGEAAGLLQPQRLYIYLGELMHESGTFRYDKEIWGPTAAQKKYEGRKDLGNTKKGDGKKFIGRTAIQITGRLNTTKFWKWCQAKAPLTGLEPPDFTENPDLLNTDPWEGVGPIWYWDEGNPKKESLNRYADVGNVYMVTQLINGGQNGASDRWANIIRAGLVIAGYSKDDVKGFQKDNGLDPDGLPGNATRVKLHEVLGGKNPFKQVVAVTKQQVVEVPKPVALASLDKPWYTTPEGLGQAAAGPIGVPVIGFMQGLDTDKILVWFGVGVAIAALFFGYRYLHQKHQNEQVAAIKADAKETKAAVSDANDAADVKLQELKDA